MAQRTVVDDIKDFFRGGSMLKWLMVVNIGIFLLVHLIGLFIYFAQGDAGIIQYYNSFDSYVNVLASTTNLEMMLFKPWSLITHMFLHMSFSHIFFNLLLLFIYGRMIQQFLGEDKILPLYILGGLSGWLVMTICFNIFPVFATANALGVPALGASAAVWALAAAITTHRPNLEMQLYFFIPVKLKWVTIIFLALNLVTISNGTNPGGKIAHLGGALFGFLAMWQYQKGRDWFSGFNRIWAMTKAVFTPSRKRKPKMRVEYKRTQSSSASRSTRPKSTQRKKQEPSPGMNQQQKVDAILDKISQSGYESLTKAEKEFLFKFSKRD